MAVFMIMLTINVMPMLVGFGFFPYQCSIQIGSQGFLQIGFFSNKALNTIGGKPSDKPTPHPARN
jgi:hypothetical protein